MLVMLLKLAVSFASLTFHHVNLSQFLTGLLLLEPERDEFVSRKIKQIFSRYFHGFLQVCCQFVVLSH